MGYRHLLVYGLSGFMHKHHIAIGSTDTLIQKLSINDEEKHSRLLVLHSTYQKNPKVVSGYHCLLSVLENVADGGRVYAKKILSRILSVISVQTNKREKIINLTERCMTEFTIKTMRDNEEIYYYDTTAGVYRRFGDRVIKEYVELLNPSIRTLDVNEIIQKIRRRTYVDRDEFDNNPNIINVQNGLLNIWTGEFSDQSPDFLTIVQLPIVYNPNSKCPAILRFLGQILHPKDVFTAIEFIGYLLFRSAVYEKGFRDISVEKVRKVYEYNSNTVQAFLDDKCVIDLAAPDYMIPTVYLYNEYENFCQEKHVRPLEMNVFGSKLKEYGIERERIRSHGDREYHYFGIQLKSNLRGQNQSLFN
jgi:phage/plasmid-associated DNA primase